MKYHSSKPIKVQKRPTVISQENQWWRFARCRQFFHAKVNMGDEDPAKFMWQCLHLLIGWNNLSRFETENNLKSMPSNYQWASSWVQILFSAWTLEAGSVLNKQTANKVKSQKNGKQLFDPNEFGFWLIPYLSKIIFKTVWSVHRPSQKSVKSRLLTPKWSILQITYFAIKLYQTCTIEWVVINFVSGRNRKPDQTKDGPIFC